MISEGVVQFDTVLAMAYRLTALEKIRLVKRLADVLEQEPALAANAPVQALPPPSEQTWGQQVIELLHTLDTSDWRNIDMPDVVDWVKQQRAEQEKKRGIFWGSEE